MTEMNEAMVFAAGFGKRMLPVTKKTPKPLVKIKNKTLIYYIIEELIKLKFVNIVVNTHHLHEKIVKEIKSFEPIVRIIFEEKILDTGGGFLNALQRGYFLKSDEPKLLLNSDIFWRKKNLSPIENICRNWDSNIMDILISLKSKEDFNGYIGDGDFNVKKDKNGLVKIISNKNHKKFVFTGIQAIKPKLIKNYKKRFSMREIFFEQLKKGTLYGIEDNCSWFHISTISDLKKINKMDI